MSAEQIALSAERGSLGAVRNTRIPRLDEIHLAVVEVDAVSENSVLLEEAEVIVDVGVGRGEGEESCFVALQVSSLFCTI